MSILKLRQTCVGSYDVETLMKQPPSRIPRRERSKMSERHCNVLIWAEENLTGDRQIRFDTAVLKRHYDDAYNVLIEEFHTNKRITLWRRRSWDKWIQSFGEGFHPVTS